MPHISRDSIPSLISESGSMGAHVSAHNKNAPLISLEVISWEGVMLLQESAITPHFITNDTFPVLTVFQTLDLGKCH